ncbi:MAG: alpha/beta fold hydrolase [Bacteroidales bacterium]
MKRYIIYSLVVILLSMANCSTPYKKLAKFKTMDELEYSNPVKKVKLPESGYEIAYTDIGSGNKTIIFIHGLGSYLQAWKKNVEVLKDHYRCISIDLPGYGKSSKQPHSGQMTFYAGVVNEFVAKLGLSKVVLSGHSMGGQISITAALRYPNIVESLILVDPAGFERFNKGQKQWFRDVMTLDGVRLTTAEAIQNNLATNFYRLPSDADFMITDRISMRSASDFDAYCYAVVQSVSGMVDEPVIDHLKDVNVPTLIFFGENDNLIPNRFLNPGRTVDIAQYGASQIKDSRLVMVPKCGHFMMYEKSETYNSEVIKFLDQR